MSSENSGEAEDAPEAGIGKNIGRRRLLKMLTVGGGLAAAGLLPRSWRQPSVDQFGAAAGAQVRLPSISKHPIPSHSPIPSATPMPTPAVSQTPRPTPSPSPSPAAAGSAGQKPSFTG